MGKKTEILNTMRLLWDEKKNKEILGKTFDEVTSKHTYFAFWNCEFDNGKCPPTKKSPQQVYQAIHNGTPVCCYCKGKHLEGKTIMEVAPEEVNKYWNYERNDAMGNFPESTSFQSNINIYVKCEKHYWGIIEQEKQRCADLVEHIPCPKCSHKEANQEYNLKVEYPAYAKKLHPAFNPELILPGSNESYPWWCDLCKDYYFKKVSLRTSQNQGCPIHNTGHQHSKTEELLLLVMNEIIGGFDHDTLKSNTWPDGREVELDLKNHMNITVEYDGKYHDSESQQKRDQTKNELVDSSREEVSIFIRIREKDLPPLTYFENQFEALCDKHESSYRFLIPAIQKTLKIINEKFKLNLNNYTDEELAEMIKRFIPTAVGNASLVKDGGSFGEHAPGLLMHLDSKNRNPFTVSKGSTHIFNVTCPNPECRHVFSQNKSMAKKLSKSKGLCSNCLYFVEDFHKENSPLIRWYPKVSYNKSLQGKAPEIAIYYSKKNPISASEIAWKSSISEILWNCPFCLEEYRILNKGQYEYKSTNKVQANNGCKCKVCGKMAIYYVKNFAL